MRNWRHSGFSVHNEVVINENDREALVRLACLCVPHADRRSMWPTLHFHQRKSGTSKKRAV